MSEECQTHCYHLSLWQHTGDTAAACLCVGVEQVPVPSMNQCQIIMQAIYDFESIITLDGALAERLKVNFHFVTASFSLLV